MFKKNGTVSPSGFSAHRLLSTSFEALFPGIWCGEIEICVDGDADDLDEVDDDDPDEDDEVARFGSKVTTFLPPRLREAPF